MEFRPGIDRIDLFAILFAHLSASGEYVLLSQDYCPLDNVFYRGIRHIIAGNIYISVVERFCPVFERHCTVERHTSDSVDDTEKSAHCRCLIVAVESHCAAYEEGLVDIASSVEQRENSHRTVQIGVPDAAGDVVFVEIEFVGHCLAGRLPVVRVLLPKIKALVDDGAETVFLGEVLLCMADKRRNVFLEKRLRVHGPVHYGG